LQPAYPFSIAAYRGGQKDGNFNEDGSLGEGRKAHLLLLINGINNFPVPGGNRKQLNLPGFISNIVLTASI
jgi:hypothetical protein